MLQWQPVTELWSKHSWILKCFKWLKNKLGMMVEEQRRWCVSAETFTLPVSSVSHEQSVSLHPSAHIFFTSEALCTKNFNLNYVLWAMRS